MYAADFMMRDYRAQVSPENASVGVSVFSCMLRFSVRCARRIACCLPLLSEQLEPYNITVVDDDDDDVAAV